MADDFDELAGRAFAIASPGSAGRVIDLPIATHLEPARARRLGILPSVRCEVSP